MKKIAVIFILTFTLILNSTIYASTFKDYNYEILCPNLFLNNDISLFQLFVIIVLIFLLL